MAFPCFGGAAGPPATDVRDAIFRAGRTGSCLSASRLRAVLRAAGLVVCRVVAGGLRGIAKAGVTIADTARLASPGLDDDDFVFVFAMPELFEDALPTAFVSGLFAPFRTTFLLADLAATFFDSFFFVAFFAPFFAGVFFFAMLNPPFPSKARSFQRFQFSQ